MQIAIAPDAPAPLAQALRDIARIADTDDAHAIARLAYNAMLALYPDLADELTPAPDCTPEIIAALDAADRALFDDYRSDSTHDELDAEIAIALSLCTDCDEIKPLLDHTLCAECDAAHDHAIYAAQSRPCICYSCALADAFPAS